MAGRDVPAASAALTVDGSADGYVTVADNTVFFKGAQAFLSDGNTAATEAVITEIGAAGKVGLRIVTRQAPDDNSPGGLRGPNYGRSDLTAFTVAQSAKLTMPSQFIYGA
jgi:hypothetical protein